MKYVRLRTYLNLSENIYSHYYVAINDEVIIQTAKHPDLSRYMACENGAYRKKNLYLQVGNIQN